MGRLIRPVMEHLKSLYVNRDSSEAGQHGTIAGFFSLFRKRFNIQIFQELMFGSSYVGTTVLVKGPQRASNAIPIVIQVMSGNISATSGLIQAVKSVEQVRLETIKLSTEATKALAVGVNMNHDTDWYRHRMVGLVRGTLANALNELMDNLERLAGLPEDTYDKSVRTYLEFLSDALEKYVIVSRKKRAKRKSLSEQVFISLFCFDK